MKIGARNGNADGYCNWCAGFSSGATGCVLAGGRYVVRCRSLQRTYRALTFPTSAQKSRYYGVLRTCTRLLGSKEHVGFDEDAPVDFLGYPPLQERAYDKTDKSVS